MAEIILPLIIGLLIGAAATAVVMLRSLRSVRRDRDYFFQQAKEWREGFFEMARTMRNAP